MAKLLKSHLCHPPLAAALVGPKPIAEISMDPSGTLRHECRRSQGRRVLHRPSRPQGASHYSYCPECGMLCACHDKICRPNLQQRTVQTKQRIIITYVFGICCFVVWLFRHFVRAPYRLAATLKGWDYHIGLTRDPEYRFSNRTFFLL